MSDVDTSNFSEGQKAILKHFKPPQYFNIDLHKWEEDLADDMLVSGCDFLNWFVQHYGNLAGEAVENIAKKLEKLEAQMESENQHNNIFKVVTTEGNCTPESLEKVLNENSDKEVIKIIERDEIGPEGGFLIVLKEKETLYG